MTHDSSEEQRIPSGYDATGLYDDMDMSSDPEAGSGGIAVRRPAHTAPASESAVMDSDEEEEV